MAAPTSSVIQGLDYWYDAQMRRFLEQIVLAFSGFRYRTGVRDGNEGELRLVPCRMATTDRMAASILRNGSDNTLLSVPMITVYQTAIAGRRENVQNLTHVDKRQIIERAIDPVTGRYTSEPGNRYTVERMMPRPFEMTVQVDIWTSNLDQKHQLAEQIMTVFFPDIQIQNSDNPLDWAALTRLSLDDINWSSRTIPVGSGDEIDIMTLTLRLPFWLNPPAKVTYQKIIEQVVLNVGTVGTGDDFEYTSGVRAAQIITTPGNHYIRVENGRITLLGPAANEVTHQGLPFLWDDLIVQYGNLRPTVSRLRLKTGGDIENPTEIIGTMQLDPNDPSVMLWQVDPDTLPANTLLPIDGVIDPLRVWPGNGLPLPNNGTRYLMLSDIGANTVAWGTLAARSNDIVEYRDGAWSVVFEAIRQTTTAYVLNLFTGRQLRWDLEQGWVMAIDGTYAPGYWRISL